MSTPSSTEVTAGTAHAKRRVPDDVPLLIVFIGVAISSLLVIPGVFAVGNYIEDITTITITNVAWDVVLHGEDQHEYTIACQSDLTGGGLFGVSSPMPTGINPCPYRAHPGSDYNASFYVGSFYRNSTMTLVTPAPFELISTTPSLPAPVPSGGFELTVELKLPTTAGQYTFLGDETFS
jgi:hypothetical protein